jgi:outer membrane protein
MSSMKFQALVAAATLGLTVGAAHAQLNIVKGGFARYTTNSKTNGITGIGVPPGADAEVGNATAAIFTYERLVQPNLGVEFVLGIPPTIHAKGAGSVAFLGDDVLSAKNVAPTLLVNYHFGVAGDTWRPYLGAGVNYTRFTSAKSVLAPTVHLSDSVGLAAQAGVDYALDKQWGFFGSISVLQVKSDLVAINSSVLQTTIDFRPVVYSFGVSYRF